jgi:hypothetical protein
MATVRIALMTIRLVMRTKVALFFTFIFPKQHDYLEMKLYNFVKHPCLEGLEGS